ncbi:alpha/beta hydrolase [Pontivivens ytuae]|uniref:Alpha/beta fold hydrolase n=1 Tax=Pontivivens ytuae TaxID=2789856 RepID=A0A7S9LWA5_9RHOB|nr:alpha/beta fold hydrolase [Pontivivens ytuae]QPH56155.1 alpha/beta fold hydrolase [Pontivivens ytuae]
MLASPFPNWNVLALGVVASLHCHIVQADIIEIPGPGGALAGERVLVEGAAQVVVIVPGSGPIDRDGNGAQVGLHSDTYRLLAEALADQGISSIRIDKRGLFGSADAVTDPNDVTIAEYADDVLAWVETAREIAPCVWVAGHSEGGLVALTAAEREPEAICGLVLLATAGRPIGQLMLEQMHANPANAALMPDLEAIMADLQIGRTRPLDQIPEALRALFSPSLQRFMIDLFSHDPLELARTWSGPALIIQGRADQQVRPLDATLLNGAMPQADLQLIEGMTHMLKPHVPGAPLATYTDPSIPLHPAIGALMGVTLKGALD